MFFAESPNSLLLVFDKILLGRGNRDIEEARILLSTALNVAIEKFPGEKEEKARGTIRKVLFLSWRDSQIVAENRINNQPGFY